MTSLITQSQENTGVTEQDYRNFVSQGKANGAGLLSEWTKKG
jgi:hypothetical protein